MSMSRYPGLNGIASAFEIAVDDPGYTTLWMRVLAADEYLGVEDWTVDPAGGDLGIWLSEMTTRALCTAGEYDGSVDIASNGRTRDTKMCPPG